MTVTYVETVTEKAKIEIEAYVNAAFQPALLAGTLKR
jgi:hypothetical protein